MHTDYICNKSQYPRSYEYIEHLIRKGINEIGMMDKIQRKSLASWLLADHPPLNTSEMIILDPIKAIKCEDFMCTGSVEKMINFQYLMADWVIEGVKHDVIDMFDMAVGEYSWETREFSNRELSDHEDWKLQDNSSRMLDFNQSY